MNITKDLAIQSTEYIKQFCEKLRLDPNVDLMKVMSYQDIASCYISLQRIETFVTQSVTAVEPAVQQGNSVEVETLQGLLQNSAQKIAELQGVISGLHAKLHTVPTEESTLPSHRLEGGDDTLPVEEEIQVIELHAEEPKKVKRKQISQIVSI